LSSIVPSNREEEHKPNLERKKYSNANQPNNDRERTEEIPTEFSRSRKGREDIGRMVNSKGLQVLNSKSVNKGKPSQKQMK
jgi:hypothetical protein